MLSVANRERYANYRSARDSQPRSKTLYYELILPALLFGSIGAIAWAVRGTTGWGGIDGTIVPGMMWGILWYYLCWRNGIACHGVPLWLGLGIALGGELGYGQYVSWIQGIFRYKEEILPTSPMQGWAWFFLCGIGWAAPGAATLGWALSNKSSLLTWLGRLTIPFGTAALGWLLVQWFPAVFFPNHSLGIYADIDRHLERTIYTNTQNFTVVAWWIGVVAVAVLQCDKTSLLMGALIGAGFGPGFMTAAAWCLGYKYAPDYIDWWKVWELQSGFNLGILYALALYWCMRQLDKTHDATGEPIAAAHSDAASSATWSIRTAFETAAVFLMVVPIFLENEPIVSTLMGLLYAAFMAWLIAIAARGLAPTLRAELRGRISILYCVFLFLFVTFHGATSTLGLVLELYPPESVDQYSWPAQRILLFAPLAAVVALWTVYHMIKTLWPPTRPPRNHDDVTFPNRIADLMTGLAAVGALSIWPSKIGILYAIVLCAALWAFHRLNQSTNSSPRSSKT